MLATQSVLLRLPSLGPVLAIAAIAALASQVSVVSVRPATSAESFAAPIVPQLQSDPLSSAAPAGAQFELILHVQAGSDLAELLRNAGTNKADAKMAAAELRKRESDSGDADVRLIFGNQIGDGRRLIQLIWIADSGTLTLGRVGEGFAATDRSAFHRIDLSAGPQLYWQARGEGLQPAEVGKLQKFAQGVPSGSSISAVIGKREDRFGGHDQSRLLFLEARTRSGALSRSLMLPDGQWVDLDSASHAEMIRPVPGRVTSGFGSRWHPILQFIRPHLGVDFAASFGEPIVAAADGVVQAAGWHGGYGRQVRIGHGAATASSYSHLSGIAVVAGQHVRRGQVIGYAGASGLATGPHLHFEVYRNGIAVNPLNASVGIGHDPLERPDVKARLRQLGLSLS